MFPVMPKALGKKISTCHELSSPVCRQYLSDLVKIVEAFPRVGDSTLVG